MIISLLKSLTNILYPYLTSYMIILHLSSSSYHILHLILIYNPIFFLQGVISQLTPALALFYGQTANKNTINYFYRNNIRINNTLLILVFTALALQLNLEPGSEGLLNRNVLLGCHKPNTSYTMDEFAFSEHFLQEFL